MKCGHPVKMVYDRMEDLAATTKRHPSRVRHRTALDANGKLLAMDIEIATDGGAYSTLSSTVLSRATLHSPGPYVCPNVRVRSHAWATNTVPYGAFRGFGAPQTVFAVERHMDEIAAAIGMDPIELRRRNFIHQGETTATEQLMREPVILDKLLDRALAESDYYNKRARFARENPHERNQARHGHRRFLSRFRLYRLRRTLSQFARRHRRHRRRQSARAGFEHRVWPGHQHRAHADRCRNPRRGLRRRDHGPARHRHRPQQRTHRRLAHRDGDRPPHRARIVCSCLPCCANKPACPSNSRASEFFAACERLRAKNGEVVSLCRYEAPPGIFWDDQKYRGEAYPAYAWSVHVAQVAVDTVTYSAEVEEFWSVQEAGRVIHPVLAGGPDRRRHRARHRLRALRKSRPAERPHGQQPDDQLHHAHRRRRSADSCLLGGDSLSARRIRRQRHRRIASRRARARDSQCDPRRNRHQLQRNSAAARGPVREIERQRARSRSPQPYERGRQQFT